jgi:predicted RNA-binding protein with RPS1 domain
MRIPEMRSKQGKKSRRKIQFQPLKKKMEKWKQENKTKRIRFPPLQFTGSKMSTE